MILGLVKGEFRGLIRVRSWPSGASGPSTERHIEELDVEEPGRALESWEKPRTAVTSLLS